MVDYVLVEMTNVAWPGALPWRNQYSRRGYPTEAAAEARARTIRHHYAATYGVGGPDLRVRRREGASLPFAGVIWP